MRRASLLVLRLGIALNLVGVSVLGVAFFARQHIARLALDLPPFSHRVGESRTFKLPMRDQVRLQTQVILPEGDGPWPVIIIRNPYNVLNLFTLFCELFARYGYACVHQDVRGRMGSEGTWYPLIHEREDGLDLFEWLRDQPFQNGRWGLWGMSYLAGVHWSLADAFPDEVETLVSIVFGVDSYRVMYESGLFRPDVFGAWAALMPGPGMALENGPAYRRFIRSRPHRTADEAELGYVLPWYRAWVDASWASDPLWSEPPFTHFKETPAQIDVPVLMIAGWYDPFFDAQHRDFSRLATRAESKLVVGPWHHLHQGAADFDLLNDIGIAGQWQLFLDWLGHHLRGEPLDQPVGVVESYDLGEKGWRRRLALPPLPHRRIRWHLRELSEAGGRGGRLTQRRAVQAEASVNYLYNPEDPVPSHGGASALSFAFRTFPSVQPGALRQPRVGQRPDVLSFVSEPLPRKMHLAGSIRARLRVSSSAPDTAFGFELMVRPRGDRNWYHVREAFQTLAHREGNLRRTPYPPGEVVEVEVESWPIEWTFPAGSQLRLDVSSSSFPVYMTHANTDEPWGEAARTQVAQQTLHSGSWVELPTRERDPPVLSGSALGTVRPAMACTFDIDLPGSADDIVQRAQKMVEDAGGEFAGNTDGGNYKLKLPVGSVEGNYVIEGGHVRFDITKKPMLVPCSAIESFLRDKLKA